MSAVVGWKEKINNELLIVFFGVILTLNLLLVIIPAVRGGYAL